MPAYEVNFDGLVGPTHSYAGLASGNKAAQSHAGINSNPRAGALQGIAKMRRLLDLGLYQGGFPPHQRPDIRSLRSLGFTGSDQAIITRVAAQYPQLLAHFSSAAAMWCANAATVSPSADCRDRKIHFTPANLAANLHRAIETKFTAELLQLIFANPEYFVHHPAIKSGVGNLPEFIAAPAPATGFNQQNDASFWQQASNLPFYGDEGAANHNRLCAEHGVAGLEIFVYGTADTPKINDSNYFQGYFPRQVLASQQQIASQHGLAPSARLFVQQHPAAIAAGVFHNDVIALANTSCLLYHEQAFADQHSTIARIRQHAEQLHIPLRLLPVAAGEVSLTAAICSYLFNSQLLSLADDTNYLILSREAEENDSTRRWLATNCNKENGFAGYEFFDLQQSMQNGGGPACLRLRVVMDQRELSNCHQGVMLTRAKCQQLEAVVTKYYRDRLNLSDFADPQLLKETYTVLDQITQILQLGSIYDFQR